MKNLILALSIVLLTPACHTLDALVGVPTAVVDDVVTVLPDPQPKTVGDTLADTAGTVASTGATALTGDAALGGVVGAAVAALTGWGLSRRRRATPPAA